MNDVEETIPVYDLNDSSLTLKWSVPTKRIYSSKDITNFLKSKALYNINAIVTHICSKVSLKDVRSGMLDTSYVDFENKEILNKDEISHQQKHPPPPSFTKEMKLEDVSSITWSILNILDELVKLEVETPPIPGPRRYGNFAFRDWQDKMTSNIDKIIDEHLLKFFNSDNMKGNYDGFKIELKFYLCASFGSRDRMDYGTGHELAFVSFLGCFIMSGLIDYKLIKGEEYLMILAKYYDLVKSLILRYTLEPAGSHGVWGLDDHFHLIYVFGSCQLIDFKMIGKDMKNDRSEEYAKVLNYRMGLTPSSILNDEILKKYRTSNLYYNAISFIRKVKSGPFAEHSPMLYEISSNKSWEKVARGMLRMFYGEVLSKFPVVQHFYFGGVFYPWVDLNDRELPSSEVNEDRIESTHFTSTVMNEPFIGISPNRGGNRIPFKIGQNNRTKFDGTTKAPWAS
ncbi:hypothetical protein CANINC_002093 [Pichia inconspicua]|uniref:Serine/threonine-protein phosphatase 2A activator n=1 Tax=Pichia inconspicua TaxID=52247 RepID=A0A4T0X248_9ASCO|nr:hypothetical protein CANINC_002093 [[Candida] inconspicua]